MRELLEEGCVWGRGIFGLVVQEGGDILGAEVKDLVLESTVKIQARLGVDEGGFCVYAEGVKTAGNGERWFGRFFLIHRL